MNDFLERFADRWEVITETGCFIWTGGSTGRYGVAWMDGKPVGAHRASLMASMGLPPPGTVASHLCHVGHCVNPAHLVWETQARNIGRKAPERTKAVAHLARMARRKKALGYYITKYGKYVAQVKIDEKSTHIGTFETRAGAVAAGIFTQSTTKGPPPCSRP